MRINVIQPTYSTTADEQAEHCKNCNSHRFINNLSYGICSVCRCKTHFKCKKPRPFTEEHFKLYLEDSSNFTCNGCKKPKQNIQQFPFLSNLADSEDQILIRKMTPQMNF